MQLCLVRHGDAASQTSDSARPLTARGQSDIRAIARFLQASSFQAKQIWHSPALRAKQTATILSVAIQTSPNLQEKQGFSPNDPPETALRRGTRSTGVLAERMRTPSETVAVQGADQRETVETASTTARAACSSQRSLPG